MPKYRAGTAGILFLNAYTGTSTGKGCALMKLETVTLWLNCAAAGVELLYWSIKLGLLYGPMLH